VLTACSSENDIFAPPENIPIRPSADADTPRVSRRLSWDATNSNRVEEVWASVDESSKIESTSKAVPTFSPVSELKP